MPINAVNLTGNVYPAGPKGDTGPANTLEIGTVEKGENASASITGEAPNQTLNLILPKGDKGEKGDTGETNSLSIGTVEKGTVPSATITGQAPNQILNLVLPKGDTGEKGEVGPRGEQGIQGNPGPINSIKIGRVEKGEEASVTIVGESPNQILNFVLPIGPKGNTGEKGDQGPKGEQGIQGETGATTSLSIGLVSSGEEASATIIGEAPDQILNLVLPKGDKGEKGNVGPQGVQGIQGETGPANSLTIGTVEKGAVPSATITGEAPNQVLNLVLPTGETAEIEAIQEEQTTQNENIEKNAECIAQNKKDVDEELTKIKEENSLLKSQIPTGTASGNSVHIKDSSNLDFDWKIKSEYRQATTQGYNFLNVPDEYHISSTDINKIVPISLKANTIYTIQAEKIISDNSDVKNYLFRFRYNNADVSNPYARIPISTLKTTYTPPSDIDTVWIYSDTGYNESTKTNTTYKNLMIYEGTENKPYEPYTGGIPSPSPDYPSKIETVNSNVKIDVTNNDNTKSQVAIMPIQQEMLTGDYISNVEHHEWKKVVLDGTENWVTITAQKGDNTSYFYYIKTDMKKASPIICNQFINRGVWSTDVEGIQSIIDNLIRLRINTSRASTVSELEAWLKSKYDEGNPVVVYYKLATPINLELTKEQKAIQEQKLYTYKNITNIAVSDKLASIDVTYKKDLETMFNNQAKEYNERLSNIENLLNTTETSALLLDNLENDLKEEV